MIRRILVSLIALATALTFASIVLAESGGSGNVADSAAASDSITVSVTGLIPGGSYAVALVSDDGSTTLALGSVTTDASGDGTLTYVDSDGMNLIGGYATLNVTDGDGKVVATNTLPAGSVAHIRHVMSGWGPSPDGLGLGQGAVTQAGVALAHANLAKTAADAGDLAGAKQHAEHIVNIIEGSEGTNFGDLDGDGATQNPGDGFGLIPYADGASSHAGFAAGTDDATSGIILHEQHVTDTFANASMWAAGARDQALNIIMATDAGMAATYGLRRLSTPTWR